MTMTQGSTWYEMTQQVQTPCGVLLILPPGNVSMGTKQTCQRLKFCHSIALLTQAMSLCAMNLATSSE